MTQGVIETLNEAKDRALASLVNEILSSEYFSIVIEKCITAGGHIDQRIQKTLNTIRIASKRDVEDLEDRLIHVERKMERIISSIEEIRETLESKTKKQRSTSKNISQCAFCGTTFTKKTPSQLFCSAVCRAKSRSEKK